MKVNLSNNNRALQTNPRALSWTLLGRLGAHLSTPLYRNGYALLVSGATTSAIGLAYWALAARLYPAYVVGLNSALLSAMFLLSGIAQLSLTSALVRFIPTAGRRTSRLVAYAYLASLTAAALLSFVFVAGVEVWSPALAILRQSPAWVWTFALATMAWGIFNLQDSALTGLRQTIWVPVENTLFAIVKIMLLVAFSGWLQLAGVFASWAIPIGLALIPVNVFIFLRLIPAHVAQTEGQANPVQRRAILRYIAGNHLGTLFSLAYTNMLPILVTSLVSPAANAYFYLPWIITNSLQLIAYNMTTSLTVEAALDQQQMGAYCRRALKQILRLLAPAVLVIVIGAPWILRLFGRAYAAEGASLLGWLAAAALPNTLVVLALGIARVQNNSWVIVLTQASVCGLVVGISYLLLPTFGIVVVGWAWFASQSIVAAALSLFMLRPMLRGVTTE